ncbi:ketoacyl-ACP synthase III [SAR86 cluster bacterium]|nr:ketoacyl-ACP synthase III [SAR86 cluster bacterium]
MIQAKIEGIEYHLASKKENLKNLKENNPDWDVEKIFEKVGVKDRFISSEHETSLSLGINAAKKFSHKILKEVDCCIFVTQTPDFLLPNNASIAQDKLNLSNEISAFDINMGCSGFVYALSVASSFLESNIHSKILIICGETYTKYLNEHDRSTQPIFSDGASATILSKGKTSKIGPFLFGTDGSGYDKLIFKNSGASKEFKNENKSIFMDGQSVLLFTMDKIPNLILELMETNNYSIDDIDFFLFHQASNVVLDNIQRKLKIPSEKLPRNASKFGNTTSSTIPILIKDLVNSKKLRRKMRIVCCGFGVGLSYGATIVNY